MGSKTEHGSSDRDSLFIHEEFSDWKVAVLRTAVMGHGEMLPNSYVK